MATPEEAKAVCLDAIEGEILLLQMELAEDKHIGFCHNDLQYGNIMMDEETKMLTIIVSLKVSFPAIFLLFALLPELLLVVLLDFNFYKE